MPSAPSNAIGTVDLRQNALVALFDDLLQRFRHRQDRMVCRDVVELVTDYLEGALSANDRRLFERHLAACPDCTAYVEQVRRTIDTLGRVQPEPPDPATRDALREAFRDFHPKD